MKDVLGHGSNPHGNADAARQLGDGHPKSAPVALHPMFGGLEPIEPPEVALSRMQRESVTSAAKRVTAIQTGEAFK
jgi:hypothetical protein